MQSSEISRKKRNRRNNSVLLIILMVLVVTSLVCNVLMYVKIRKIDAVLFGSSGSSDIAVESKTPDDWKTTEVTEGIPDSNEYDEFTVVLSPENLDTYLTLIMYDDGYKNGNTFIFTSNVYDKGWVFEECSKDFGINYEDAILNFKESPFEIRHGIRSIEDLSIKSIKGKIRFVSSKHVVSDEVDDMTYKRDVRFDNGKRAYYALDAYTYDKKW